MKRRILSAVLAALALSAAGISAAAEPEPQRLAQVELSQDGETVLRCTFSYPEGGVLPGEERMEYPAGDQDSCVYTYTYDDAGRLTQSYGRAEASFAGAEDGVVLSNLVYGEDGELVEDDSAANITGDVFMFRYTYDEQGLLTEESSSHTLADGSMSTYDALYTYDGQGRISQRLSGDNGELSFVMEYVCDEAGHVTDARLCSVLAMDYDENGMPVVTEKSEPVAETSYTYDDQGRPVREEIHGEDAPVQTGEYVYADAPLLRLQHRTDQDGQTVFLASLEDAAGQDILHFDLQGQAELTFDDAGYLVRAEAGGRTLEFSYEPAA